MSPIEKIQRTMDVNIDFFQKMHTIYIYFQVNIIGTINIIRHTTRLLIENEKDELNQRGVIINTASVAAYDGQIGQVIKFLNFFKLNFLNIIII